MNDVIRTLDKKTTIHDLQARNKRLWGGTKDDGSDKHLFVTIKKGVVEWRTSMGQTGSDPAATLAVAQAIIDKLAKRWELTPRQVEVRNDSAA